ncbi:hypothetical protein DNTS_034906 [Danionella cerebrum]|uniref:C2H2-type domain-containing protein n=1 Tax=Danionella cerebrum TaxID=2873325 RepID=A0A553QPV2_9TELE|nr:hypothetical protein DNTS_034906 [Danionella translucida]
MEAEEKQSADGEPSGGQQQPFPETSLGAQLPQLQQQATSQSVHRSHGRLQHRQSKRYEVLQRQKQQHHSQATGSSWQLSEIPGTSRGISAAQGSPSSGVHNVPQTLSLPSVDVQEGNICRPERKPQKPGKYICMYCGRPCAKPSVLEKHIRSHTGERPYPCIPCGFSFKTKSNLYKHRKSHAHRIKAGMASSPEGTCLEEGTEGESSGSEDETGQHQASTSQGRPTLKKGCKVELSFIEEGPQTEDSHAVKQRLAMRLSERKRAPRTSSDETRSSLGPGSKGSTESGYFSSSGSAELSQVSPPNASAKTYAEIILGKYGRLGQQQRMPQQQLQLSSYSGQHEKSISFTVPKTQVIEHITKLITINEAVVDTSEIDSVKPRRSSLSRRSSTETIKFSSTKETKPDFPVSCGSVVQFIPSQFPCGLTGSHWAETEAAADLSSNSLFCRSQSMPSSGESLDAASHTFRLSHSFDDQQAIAAEMRIGPHQRMLRRQPAIEMPVGADLILEDSSPLASSSKETSQEREIDPCECKMCGIHLRNQESHTSHQLVCLSKAPHSLKSEEGSSLIRKQSPIMNFKFKAMAMAVRKRKKKEESLEEDPPSPTAVSFSTNPLGSGDNQCTPCGLSQSETDRKGPWKEISVIQHTRSFEKQESLTIANEEPELECEQFQKLKPISTSRLIRQPNIQVPEILVTEEPDCEMASRPADIPKESDKVEEFQWPPRSQSLAQLPAEKLPPKKKRLRLAEASQSSGESSFESISLPHSPSQESNVSHASSRSTSIEESGKLDSEMQGSTRSSQGSHMLTVPQSLHQSHHSHKEMRRSSSEQASASPVQPVHVEGTRSKSFDYGSLCVERNSATWKEKRKCLLVKHGTLGEADQEDPAIKHGFLAVCQSHPDPTHFTVSENRVVGRGLSREIGQTLQLFQTPLGHSPSVFPVQQRIPEFCSQNQLTGFIPVTTAISAVISTQMFQQSYIHTEQSALHPTSLEYIERLVPPLQPLTNLVSLQSRDIAQTVCFPMAGGISIQVPSGPFFRELSSDPSCSDSPSHSEQQLSVGHGPSPVIAPCFQQLVPVVSLVVPVRLQTNNPTYASAMYTTISQILAKAQHPICCSTMVIMGKLNEGKLQRSYLRLPSPRHKSSIPLPLPIEPGEGSSRDDSYGQLGPGGSKRMLSPAGSLELSIEAHRHQKRVKEEEEDNKDDVGNNWDAKSQGLLQSENQQKLSTKSSRREQEAGEAVETQETRKEIQLKTEQLKEEGILDKTLDASYSSLHTTTSVSWCYLNYTKPNPSTHTDSSSVYSSWSVSMRNPNIPGLSTKTLLSLLCSKQKYSAEMYTIATASPPTTGTLVLSDGKEAFELEVGASSPKTPLKEELAAEKRGEDECSEDVQATSGQSEVALTCMLEGGYKSSEDYVYVRGRGRGKYVCSECGIRCKKPSMLKKHIRTHTDVRPFVWNLTKHVKSKAHAAGSQKPVCEEQQKHQFSDVEDSDAEDDDDEEEDFSSHDEPSSVCSTDTHQSTADLSESGPGSQSEPPDPSIKEEHPLPHSPWPGIQVASPGSKRALFSRRGWEVSPRAFSPSSESSSLRSFSPRLELSPTSRHLSPSPERGISPNTRLSPLRSLSPLRPVSPVRHRSARGPSSLIPLKPQHRPHSSPAGVHWEPSTPLAEREKDKPGTDAGLQMDPCLFSPTARCPPTEPFPASPATLQKVNRMFSHLPLHSQDQARMPYHMIPIGGIQMVQLRPPSRPKLERQSSITPSPTSPREDSMFSMARRDYPWISDSSRTKSQDGRCSQEPCSPSTSTALPKPCSPQQGVGKPQYDYSSSDTKTCTFAPGTSRKSAADCDEGAERNSKSSSRTA